MVHQQRQIICSQVFNAGMHWEISCWLGLMRSEWHALWNVLEDKSAEIHTNVQMEILDGPWLQL